MAAVGLAALPGRSHLRLDARGFEIKTPLRARRFAWADVTPFVAAKLSYAELVVFRSRRGPDAALPDPPEPTAADLAKGADALPNTYGHDAAALAALMNRRRERALPLTGSAGPPA